MNYKNRFLLFVRILPLVIMLVCIIITGVHLRGLTAQNLQTILPQNYVGAALILLVFYALKSLSVFFPVVVLQLCAGLIFPWPIAIIISIVGAAVESSLPYWIGRYSGVSSVDRIFKKYPKARSITKFYRGQEFFFSFLLRAVACLPLDIVSMLLGSMKLTYYKFLFGSVLGMLPGILAATVLGNSIMQPETPAFWISLAAMFVIALGSLLLYRYMLKKHS